MDGLSRVGESLPDVGAAERVQDARRQTSGDRRGAKKRKPKPGRPSGDGRESRVDEGDDRMQPTGPGDGTSVDREHADACYGRDRTIAPILSKGRLIDIAI